MEKTLFLAKIFTVGVLVFLLVPTGMGTTRSRVPPSVVHAVENTTVPTITSVPEGVEIGDLMLVDLRLDQSRPWKRPGLYNEHSAIYVGNNTLIEANGVVRYRNFTQFSQWCKNYIFLRVRTANESQRQAAVEWAKSKIGLPYQVFFDFPWFGLKIADTDKQFPTAHELYCSELLWAAYYNQGIDLDRDRWIFPCWITPNDILYDDDIEVLFRNVTNSTEILQPDKGVYVANKKISITVFNTVVVGSLDIEVSTENEMITRVDFYIDGVYKANDTTPPYTWRWNERGSGKKVIKAVACDDEGNEYSSKITVLKLF